MLRRGDFLQNGRYQIEEDQPIGKGGQGSVYKAIDFNLNIVVAIKEAKMESPALSKAFEREAQKLATLSHSGLPTCSNHFEENQNQYLVMAYIGGPDFAQLLKQQKKPFPVLDVLNWADTLLDVVIYLHSLKNPLIHRDIKPANLKLDTSGRVVLLDLGVATGGLTEKTILPLNGFTPPYAALEQEQRGPVDGRADIYAIGMTLYHLLTYNKKFLYSAGYRNKQDIDPLKRADELNPQVPRALADLLADATALKQEQRIPNTKIMRNRLAQIRMSMLRPPEQSTQPKEPPWGIVRLLLGGAVAALFLVLFVGMFRTIIGGESSSPDIQATTPTDEPVVVLPTNITASPTQLITQNPEPIATQTALPAMTLTPSVIQATKKPVETITFVPTPITTQEPLATITLIPTIEVQATTPTQVPDSANPPVAQPPVLVGTPLPRPVIAISPDNVQQITQLARFGKGQIEEIAYSPDGSLLAVASNLGIYIYDAETLAQIRLIETNHLLSSATFSTDGRLLAAGGRSDPTIRVWRVSDGVLIAELAGHQNSVNSVLFSPDGLILASGANDDTVRLWNVSDGMLRQTLRGHNGGVTNLAFDATGQILASASYDTTVRVWQTSDGQQLNLLEGHNDLVRAVAIHPTGELIATGSQDGVVKVWQEGNLLYTLSDFSGSIQSVTFSPNGEILATGSYFDKEISLWQAKEGILLETLEQAGISDLIFSPDGNTLATTFWGHSIELWRKPADQLYGFTSFGERTDHSNGMTSVDISPDGRFVISGSYDQRVRVWDLQESRLFGSFAGHSALVTDVAFSGYTRDGKQVPYFTSGSSNQDVIVWNDGEVIYTLKGHEDEVTNVAFQKNGLTVASGSKDKSVRLWRSDGLLHTLTGHTDEVTSITFNKNDEHIISGSKDGTVRLWKVEEGTLMNTFGDLNRGVTSVAEANNDQIIAAGLDNGTIALWRDGSRLGILEGHQGAVNGLSLTANGKLLASGSDDDSAIMLWRIEDGQLIQTLPGHNWGITALTFSLNDTQLISSSNDGTIRLWGIRP